jgi:hypothetical protein
MVNWSPNVDEFTKRSAAVGGEEVVGCRKTESHLYDEDRTKNLTAASLIPIAENHVTFLYSRELGWRLLHDMISTVLALRTVLTSQLIHLCPRHITKYWYKRWHATSHLQLNGHATLHLPFY